MSNNCSSNNNENNINIINNEEAENSNSSPVNINIQTPNLVPDKNSKGSSNTYSLLSTSLDNSDSAININRLNEPEKSINGINSKPKKSKRKKKKPKYFFKNIYTKKAISGIVLNLFFWLWTVLVYLDHHKIIKFPRAVNEKIHMVYGTNSDSFLGSFFSTLFYTIFNYFVVFLYPEIIFFVSYFVYVAYSIFNMTNEKFKEDSCLLSKNTYIFLVFLTFGEIYKLYARKYLDI